jgi:peptide/nickel transport system permease protein
MYAAIADARFVLSRNPVSLFAFVLLALIGAVAVLAPYLVPHDPFTTDAARILQPPGARHWFGTDHLGRDIFSRVLVAGRIDLAIAFAAVALSFSLGLALGLACGYYRAVDVVVSRLADVLTAFPLFVLAVALVAALGNTVTNVVYATAVINLPFYIRLARIEVNVRRNSLYVDAARLSGNSELRILLGAILPNILPTMMIQVSQNLGWAILNAAGLSFIGLGVRPPEAEWGIMVAEGAPFVFSGSWWVSAFPGAALVLSVLCFNLIGDALRDLLDPRARTAGRGA